MKTGNFKETGLEDELGDIVQKARAGKGLSQAELAKTSGLLTEAVARIESYDMVPDDSGIKKIAEALNLHSPSLIAIAHKAYMPIPPKPDPDFDLVCLRVSMGMYPVKCYLLICKQTRETAVIDTGANPDVIIRKADDLGVTPIKILLTHNHPDHAGGLNRLDAKFNCPTWVGKVEPHPSGSRDLRLLEEHVEIKLGHLRIQTIHTPGHTSGGICYKVNNSVVSGDTIFAGSMGRANVSFKSLFDSVAGKLLALPDSTGLFPGHGPATTVGQEKRHNPFFFSHHQN